MMHLCCHTKPLCSLAAKPAHAAAAAAARRIGMMQKPSAAATCSITTQATGIDPGIVPGTFPPNTPGGGVDPGPVPGIDPAPGPAPDNMPPGIDPRTNPGAPPGPSIIPGRGDPPPGIDTPGLPGPVPGIDPAPGINPGDLGSIESRMSTGASLLSSLAFWSPQATPTPTLRNSSSNSTAGAWITLSSNVPLTVSLRGYSSINAGDASSKPEVNPEAGDARPDASGPPSGQPDTQPDASGPLSGQPGAQPEASGLPSGQPGDLADFDEPAVGKDRTEGPGEVRQAAEKRPEESANPDRVPFWGS